MSLLTPQRPAQGAHTHDATTFVPDTSRAERRRSFDLDAFPVPLGREEDWRFTPVDRLGTLFEVAETDADRLEVRVDAPAPVTVERTTVPADGDFAVPADRAAVVARASAAHATVVTIPADAEVSGPIHIDVRGTDGARVNGHLRVVAGRFAKATVVLRHSGSAACGATVAIDAQDGADLTFVSLQEWDDDAVHLAQHDVRVGRDAHVKHVVVTLGGRIVRLSTNAVYAGSGGSFEGLGVYFADEGQHLEHRLFVDHEAPHCRSNVEYKGALQGDSAHTVWVGDVLIRAAAEGTDTYELNRNLLLTEGARADSVPNLEIETGEIAGAGHASATGRFDDEQLFYLQARGIPTDEARRLVVRGFFASIVARIQVPEVIGHIMTAIDRELAKSETTVVG